MLEADFEAPIVDADLARWVKRVRFARMFPGWTMAEIDALDWEATKWISAIVKAEKQVREWQKK